jgi:hypothetical protein
MCACLRSGTPRSRADRSTTPSRATGTAGATFTISAFDSPNLAGLTLDDLLALPDAALDHCPRPYLVTRRWVREKYAEWGPGHPLWEARVLGQFPTQAEDALISLAWLEGGCSTSRR